MDDSRPKSSSSVCSSQLPLQMDDSRPKSTSSSSSSSQSQKSIVTPVSAPIPETARYLPIPGIYVPGSEITVPEPALALPTAGTENIGRIAELENEIRRINQLLLSFTAATPLSNLASNDDIDSIRSHNRRTRLHAKNKEAAQDAIPGFARRGKAPQQRTSSMTFQDQRHAGRPGLHSGRLVVTPDTSDDEEEGDKNGGAKGHGVMSGGVLQKPLRTFRPLSQQDGDENLSILNDTIEENTEKPTAPKSNRNLPLLLLGICLAVFLISLDRTIITTAIPKIVSEFNSYDDIGWYGSAYFLTACAFQPLYGRLFQSFDIKWTYILAMAIFEIGSLLCAVTPNSIVLILGRAVQGLGSAGILTGSFVVVTHAVPLQARPLYTATVGLVYGVGSVIGPLLGGVFTDSSATWRWCFYFNLPVGAATLVAIIFIFHPETKQQFEESVLDRIFQLDLIGNVILIGASVMLFLALQYVELDFPWSNPLVIGLLVGSAVTFILFIIWQKWKGDAALIPSSVITQRSVATSCVMSFFIYAALLLQAYYLPMWFQAVKGETAILSGVHLIPYIVTNAIFSLMAGAFVSKNGYFTPPAIIGTAIATAGCGLFYTLQVDTPTARWVGFEIFVSAGFGLAIQQGFTAVQTALALEDVPIGTAAVVACQSFGGAISVSVGNTILQKALLGSSVPGVNMQAVINAGASEFRSIVPANALDAVVEVYNSALQKVFVAAVPLMGLAFISTWFLEWRSVKVKPAEKIESA